jgi:ABC-type transport system substrate-binding protein
MADTGTGQALADARKLLAETPWKRGFSLDFYTTPNNPIRQVEEEAIASDWARIGVRVIPHFVPVAILGNSYAQGGILAHGYFQVVMWASGTDNPDDWAYVLESKYRSRGPGSDLANPASQNYYGIQDRVIDRSFDAAVRTFNRTVRDRSFMEVQRELNRQAYWIMLWPHPDVWTDDRRVRELSDLPSQGVFWNSYAWRLKGR